MNYADFTKNKPLGQYFKPEIYRVIGSARAEVVFEFLREAIEKNRWYLDRSFDLHELAVRMGGLSEVHWANAVRMGLRGVTFRQYLVGLRLEYAVELLQKSTTMNLDEVWRVAGFPSRSSFFRLFKENKGTTPNEYRRKYHQQKR